MRKNHPNGNLPSLQIFAALKTQCRDQDSCPNQHLSVFQMLSSGHYMTSSQTSCTTFTEKSLQNYQHHLLLIWSPKRYLIWLVAPFIAPLHSQQLELERPLGPNWESKFWAKKNHDFWVVGIPIFQKRPFSPGFSQKHHQEWPNWLLFKKGWGNIFAGSPVGLVFLASGADIAGYDDDCSSVGSFVGSFRVAFFVLDEFAGKSGFGGNGPPHHNLSRLGTWLFFKRRIP